MDLVQIYECFCDRTRLRILSLLARTPLCVCHFQEILGEPQVKISKHLGYLRERGMVVAERQQNWMIYSLPAKPARELEANLKCLQDCAQSDAVFKRDLKALAKLRSNCCEPGSRSKQVIPRRRRGGFRIVPAASTTRSPFREPSRSHDWRWETAMF